MPRDKSDFDTLYPYQLYAPEEILDPELMYTIPEIARLLQGLPADADIDVESEERIVAWTIAWMVTNADAFVINDPVGDEPGYFGLRSGDEDLATPEDA
jgi:hypothetical protein